MRSVIAEQDIPACGELKVARDAIITPSARDLAAQRGVRIIEVSKEDLPAASADRTVAIGSDHGGISLKSDLKRVFEELSLTIIDVGVDDPSPVDYPDIAEKVSLLVAQGKATRGIIIDGAGIGSCMAANKIKGIRAALCYDKASARNSREHNNANVLTLGGRLQTPTQAEEVLRVWLATPFAGGRHQARVDKIAGLEERYANWTPQN
jgi:ribose 5-phosphate isomerase B